MTKTCKAGRYGVGEYLNESAQGVKLFLGILIVITLARNANAHPVGHILDPLAPQIFVELLIYPHIAGAHHLLGELTHLINGTGCPGLEGPVPYITDTFVTQAQQTQPRKYSEHIHELRFGSLGTYAGAKKAEMVIGLGQETYWPIRRLCMLMVYSRVMMSLTRAAFLSPFLAMVEL